MSAVRIQLLGKGLNQDGWKPVIVLLESLGAACTVHEDHTTLDPSGDMIVLLGYDRMVPESLVAAPRLGTVLFHSSDLPEGRGWAPIYNTMIRGLGLTQTMLYAVEAADAGPIVAKARYPLAGNEIESEVRRIDDRLTLRMLETVLPDLLQGRVEGAVQDEGAATYWPRRTPEESRVTEDMSISDLLRHLRALPESAPAFIFIGARRFQLRLAAAEAGETFDPDRVVIERYYA
ncbi:formyltransferase family protein [Pseudodesulfovibrio methanolicus]|uniref:Formyltransferase family protein n=1 Tax=Pseudodesulfovibrio methanolicus TaxID=3126690 RepID=A0ABZ2J102_9BACT